MNPENHNLKYALAAFLLAGLAGFALFGGLRGTAPLEQSGREELRASVARIVGGKRPSGTESASCVDVAFTAYCPGSLVGTKGVLRNFTGSDASTLGDAALDKPACKVEELRVVVDAVRPCGK
jgi:hypothetical protein